MSNTTINLIFTVIFFVGIILIILKFLNSSPEDRNKLIEDADKRKSDAIKRGIRNSKLYGSKKDRKLK